MIDRIRRFVHDDATSAIARPVSHHSVLFDVWLPISPSPCLTACDLLDY